MKATDYATYDAKSIVRMVKAGELKASEAARLEGAREGGVRKSIAAAIEKAGATPPAEPGAAPSASTRTPKGARKATAAEIASGDLTGKDVLTAQGETDYEVVQVEPGGIDPRLVEARDAAIEAERTMRESTRARPVPATIDPRLVEIREATRPLDEADRRGVSAREAPAR